MSAESARFGEPEILNPEILDIVRSETRVELTMAISERLLYFRGHFPGFAILPGVVQLDWAIQYGREYFALGEVRADEIRIKFRKPIRPNHRVTLILKYLPARNSIQFDYRDADGACSSGQVRFASE